MDNREFAKVLLTEASELLESGGQNSTDSRYREARLKNIRKEIAELKAKGKDNFTEDDKKRLRKLMTAEMYVDGAYGGNEISMPGSKYFGEAYARKASPASVNHGNISLGKDAARYSRHIAAGKADQDGDIPGIPPSALRKYDGIERYDRSDRKVNPIHKKINDRAKKTQNESIAVLLTEAALLLNDDN